MKTSQGAIRKFSIYATDQLVPVGILAPVWKEGSKAGTMTKTILANEPAIRLVFFLGIFAPMVVWEFVTPRRGHSVTRWVRWPSNLGIVAINTVVLRVLFPVAAVGLSVLIEDKGWGLLNAFALPSLLAIVMSVVLLDLAIYLQHVVVHAVPALWRLHRMHHTDLDFDVTTGARFHPVEIILSMGIKLAVVAAVGPPVVAVLIFEVLLNASSMFNHGNVCIAPKVDRVLRFFVVTPDMHRVHHSVLPHETNSNFGFCLPWWDRLFGTYRDQPGAGHAQMTIGIEGFRDPREQRLDRMLTQPVRGPAGAYPINRRDS